MTIIQEFKDENNENKEKKIKEDFIDKEDFDYNKSYNNSVSINNMFINIFINNIDSCII